MKTIILLCTLVFVISNQVFSDTPDKPKNQHSIGIKFSFLKNAKSEVEVGIFGDVKASNEGLGGKITYNYLLDDEFAINVSAGLLSSSVTVSATETSTSSIIPIMLGVKYFLISYSNEKPVKPYLTGASGLLIGSETETSITTISASTETALNLYIGAGADFVLGSLVKLNVNAGYNLASDFSEPIGSRKNFSGPEFSFGVGLMF